MWPWKSGRVGGWVGPSLKENLCLTISIHLVLSHVGLFPKSKKFIISINKLTRFYPFYPQVKSLLHIPNLHCQVQNYAQDIIKNNLRSLSQFKMLCIPNYHCKISKPPTHTVFEERWDTKLKNDAKFVKGMPLVPMPLTKSIERVSNVHEVNNNRTQLLFMSHNHVQHYHIFCISKYTYCHWVLYMFFSHW